MAYKVLLTSEDFGQDYTEALKIAQAKGVEVTRHALPFGHNNADELIELAAGYDAVLTGGEVWPAKAIEALAAKGLKAISRVGIGFDKIDLDAADRAGVYVTNCPGTLTNSVAEGTMALILSARKNVVAYDSEVRNGIWNAVLGRELRGQTVGMVAFGGIARRLAELLQPWGVRMIAYDTYQDPAAAETYHVEYVDLDTLYREADIISVHVPLNAHTKGMINDESFAKMKDGVVIINTARGGIIDEDALVRALKSGKVFAAGLDVFAKEPISPDHPFLNMPNVVLHPHASALTQEGLIATFNKAIDNFLEVMSGGPVHNMVNHIE